jgi:hypothetical protein
VWVKNLRNNMDMIFGMSKIRSLYRAGSIVTISNELSKYKLDLVEQQEVRWEGSGNELPGEYTLSYGKGKENRELGTGFICA